MALRFTFCALASNTRNIRFDTHRLEGYRNFCNKIWNAARYVLMNIENQDLGNSNTDRVFSLADQWITSKLQLVISQAHKYFEQFRFDLLAQLLYEFVWNEYCDWYLELSKPILYQDNTSNAEKAGTRYTLVSILETITRLLHPLIPFITETIWQQLKQPLNLECSSIMIADYPQAQENLINQKALDNVAWLKQIIVGIRTIRSEMNISPAKSVPIYFAKGNEQDKKYLDQNKLFLANLAKLSKVHWLEADDQPPVAATALAGEMEILIPLAGLIDKDAELDRLNKNLEKLDKEILRINQKLSNQNFIAKAPEEVITKEKQKLEELQLSFAKLNEQKERLALI